MKESGGDFPDGSRKFPDAPFLSLILIIVIGIAIWRIAPEEFEYWFPAAVIISGLLIILGELFVKWFARRGE